MNDNFRPIGLTARQISERLRLKRAEMLEQAADEGGQLSQRDTIGIICDAVAAHPELSLSEDDGAQFADLRQRAGQIFNRLLEAHWLEERPVSLEEKIGLAAASFLSFPVAAFVSASLMMVALSSGTLASVVESGTIMGTKMGCDFSQAFNPTDLD